MSCLACALGKGLEFSAEMIVRVGGIKNLDNSGVMLFPRLLVCLDCGYAQFTVPEAELESLAVGVPPK
jgi:hypothetical protein